MQELGLDVGAVKAMFVAVQETPYLLLEVPAEHAAQLAEQLNVPVRRYYVSDAALQESHKRTGLLQTDLLRAKLPDRGSVMSGDFGEILTAIFQATTEYPVEVIDPKKWRLKQDRTKPAPHSDVVQFILPAWPEATTQDRILCAEVKTKATNGSSTPVVSAIADSRKDRDGRLIKTLTWLRERALYEDLGTTSIEQINRFINAIDHPVATHDYRAVAVICSSLVVAETAEVKPPGADECALIVISVPDLKLNYEAVFDAVLSSAGVVGVDE
ncbi:Hachiman antiphage defense system protein HamA [Arthrobacter sp. NPDC058127]|uniref:Hachiman antiphage defense system protein HamA n=1 Tax=Arthrobacter sp. NPDC058127 TaxID=3346351 RepID=UPI0036E30326